MSDEGELVASLGLSLVISAAVGMLGALAGEVWGPNGEPLLYAASGATLALGVALILIARFGTIPAVAPKKVPNDASAPHVDRMIRLSETQLVALTIERGDLNARAVGVLAFDGALAVLFFAAKGTITDFGLPLLLLLVPVVLAFVAARYKPLVGPEPAFFIERVGDFSAEEFDIALLNYCVANLDNTADAAAVSSFLLTCALLVSIASMLVALGLALL
jgi:hypothetical protein